GHSDALAPARAESVRVQREPYRARAVTPDLSRFRLHDDRRHPGLHDPEQHDGAGDLAAPIPVLSRIDVPVTGRGGQQGIGRAALLALVEGVVRRQLAARIECEGVLELDT